MNSLALFLLCLLAPSTGEYDDDDDDGYRPPHVVDERLPKDFKPPRISEVRMIHIASISQLREETT